MQCGADSLQGDLIGGFNLTTKGHGSAVDHMLKFGIPIVIVGGGGYTVENVARCWAYETSIILGKEVENELPENLDYANEYKDEYFLHYNNVKHRNEEANNKDYLEKLLKKVDDHLKHLDSAPNVLKTEIPSDYRFRDEEIWQETSDPKIIDQFIFRDKGVKHLQEHHD